MVLLVNHFMVQRNYLRSPRYAFPFVGLNYFVELPDSANVLPRQLLSERQSHEFMRTAQLVEQTHWKLDGAAAYLQTPLSNNARGSTYAWKVPEIRSIFEDAGTHNSPLTVGDS